MNLSIRVTIPNLKLTPQEIHAALKDAISDCVLELVTAESIDVDINIYNT